MDTLVYFFQQEEYRAAIKRKNWQCKLLLTDLKKLIFNIQLFYEVDYHGDRCTYGIISLSVYPDLCDARWIIVSDTNVVPDIWSNWWWARLDIPTLVISINTTPYYPKPKSISPVDKHWPFIILSVHPQKNSYWIAYVQASVFGNLYVTRRDTRELVRTLWIPVRTWCQVYAAWDSRWVFVKTDVLCTVSTIEWIQGNRNREAICSKKYFLNREIIWQ